MAFKVGQVVKLKSGGPKMTVTSGPNGDAKSYNATWFAGSKNERASFPESALEEAKEEEPKKGKGA